MTEAKTLMLQEALSAPDTVQDLLGHDAALYAQLRAIDPSRINLQFTTAMSAAAAPPQAAPPTRGR